MQEVPDLVAQHAAGIISNFASYTPSMTPRAQLRSSRLATAARSIAAPPNPSLNRTPTRGLAPTRRSPVSLSH